MARRVSTGKFSSSLRGFKNALDSLSRRRSVGRSRWGRGNENNAVLARGNRARFVIHLSTVRPSSYTRPREVIMKRKALVVFFAILNAFLLGGPSVAFAGEKILEFML